ncbi:MAG: ROK family protein, partial [Candidatus Sericytochromatia bacterium]
GGGAGELGHQTIDPLGPRCGCGNRGCLEAIASGPAIARAAREGLKAGEAAAILALAGAPEAIHAGHVAEAAAAGDAFAGRIWSEAIEALAIGLGNVVTILAPDRLVIGGGVAAVGPLLLEPLRQRLAERVRLVPVDRLEVRLAAAGGEAGLLGAVAIAG